MIDWYVEVSEYCPDNYRNEKYLNKVIEIATPFMEYFDEIVSNIEDYEVIEDVNRKFISILQESPIMESYIDNGEFFIKYNKYINIRLKETTKQIYRNKKIEKILK